MSAIKNTAELRDVSFVMRNLLRVGIPVEAALMEAGNMMPAFKSQFHAGATQIGNRGWTLSKALESIFPESTMPAIIAGEESGTTDAVMDQIWKSAKTQMEIDKVLGGLKMPFILMLLGVVISSAFYIFLVPFMYASMSQSVPADYDVNPMIIAAVEANTFVMANLELLGATLMGVAIFITFLFTRRSVREAVSNSIINTMIKVKPLGIAYAQLKFGVMAQYLQIVSMAGLDADKRIELVLDVLPPPLRRAMIAFKSEMLTKGLAFASKGNDNNPEDPRHSEVEWPRYIRLAFAQANEGDWENPMREFGAVMIEDGKEKIEGHINKLKTIALILVGILVTLPVALLYTTMGQILVLSMQML